MSKQKPSKRQSSQKNSLLKKVGWGKPWQRAGLSVLVLAIATSVFALVPQTDAATTAGPVATDQVATPYGSIGKWMLTSTGGVSNWGGKKYQSKTLYEMVNVILVDPTSTSVADATSKLNADMSAAGFPSKSGHSSGFKGRINGTVYAQQPTGLNAFSDNPATSQNNHGRVFGPAPVSTGGYVWSAALSTEKPTFFFGFLTGHDYVSFSQARDALARGLVGSGQTQNASVNLANTYNNTSATTGDHDGNAVVIVLK